MQRIFTHIEQLLLTNDCVIIPEFGGFVLHPCPATYQPEEHRLCPPEKGIVFNPTLKHYDKLIPESYIKMYDMTFEEAHFSLRKDIEELYNLLDEEGSVYFNKTGFLRKDDLGKLFFEVEHNSSFVGLKPYGLYPFHLPPVAHGTKKNQTETTQIIKLETKQKSISYFRVNKLIVKTIGVSAAAVALFLLVSTPVNDVGRLSYSASLIPSEIILKGEIESISNCETTFDGSQSQITEDSRGVPYVAAQDEETKIYVSKHNEIENEAIAEAPPTGQAVESTSSKIYYAIIGSFTSEKQANQFMQQINMPELTTMGIVTNAGRVRVYAEKFDKREDAQNYILRLRANARLKDTWLFVGQ